MAAKSIKILLLEDDTAHAEAIMRELKDTRYKVRVAGTLREYYDSVAADPPDIAMLDMFLPDGGAMEVLSSHQQANPFPLLVMISHGNEQHAVAAMKAGALDYIVKSPEAFADMPGIITHAIDHWKLLQERKWGEEALRDSEKKYRAIVEMSNDVIIILQDGIISFANPRVAAMLGYEAGKIEGMEFVSFIPPENLDPVLDRYRKRMAGEKLSEIYETTLLHKSGRKIPVETSDSVIGYAGKPADLVIIRDITGRKQAEEALRESELRYRDLVNNSKNGVAIYEAAADGEDFIFKDFNSAAERIDNVKKEDIIGKSVLKAFPGVKEFGLFEVFQRVWRTGVPERHPITQYRDVRISGWRDNYVYRLSSGEIVAIYEDITESKQAEEALRESEEKNRVLFNNEIYAILIFDLETLKLLDVNDTYCRMYGYSREELLSGMTIHDITAEQQISDAATQQAISEGTIFIPLRYHRKKDGTVFTVEIVGGPYVWQGRKVMFALMHDITDRIRSETERKRVEEALRESEGKFKSIIEHISDIFYMLDLNYKMLYISPQVQMLGYTSEEMLDIWQNLVTDNPINLAAREKTQLALNTGEKQEPYLQEFMHRYGKKRLIEINESPFKNDKGEVIGIVGAARDVTERKQVEEQKNLSLKILGLLTKKGDQSEIIREILLLIKDFSGCEAVGIRLKAGDDYPYYEANGFVPGHVELENSLCTYCESGEIVRDSQGNPLLECMCGNIIRGRFDPTLSFFTPAGSFWSNCTTELLASTTDEDRQAHTRNRCNGEGYESVALIPLKGEGINIGLLQLNDTRRNRFTPDIITYYESIASSIGIIIARKVAEQTLRESEEKYRLVVENAREAIFVDAGSMFKFANRQATILTGYSQEELTSRPYAEFIHPDDRQLVAEQGDRRITGLEVPGPYSFRAIVKSGDTKWVELSAVPITWEGKPAVLSFLTDVTDRKRLEEEQRRVEKLESVGLLAGGIAHDFNNILTSILGNISLASMEAEPGSELQESLEQAEKASQRAKALTVQLLTFSKGGAPVLKLASLTELLKDTAGFALSGSKVKCNFSIPPGLWHAEIDAGQVSQVIHNLVINAQQAMPTGGSIEISAENIALSETQSLGRELPLKSGNYVRVSVADHGTGIPRDHLEKVFDPFFTTKQKGNGMGLATSFSIARQHGGHISVESELGSGSTFYLYLPASTQTSTPKGDKKETIKPADKARILVMDDEKGVREIAGRMLKHIGYKDIEFAEDGAEAIKLYQAAMESGNPFNVAILDLTIAGGMGGEIAIQKLLKIDPGVKAIVSSGYIDDPAIAKFREYGFSGVVAKPYTIEELRKAVQDVIG